MGKESGARPADGGKGDHMRRTLLIGLLGLATLIGPSSAAATDLSIEHFAPVPCSVACAYWDAPSAAGFNECANPFPPGSYDLTRLRFTDEDLIRITATSAVDYDTFVCTTNLEPLTIMTCGRLQKCSQVPEPCTGSPAPNLLAIGCTERITLSLNWLHATNGGINDEFLLISYNWSDYAPLPITITGPAEILDDTYEAGII